MKWTKFVEILGCKSKVIKLFWYWHFATNFDFQIDNKINFSFFMLSWKGILIVVNNSTVAFKDNILNTDCLALFMQLIFQATQHLRYTVFCSKAPVILFFTLVTTLAVNVEDAYQFRHFWKRYYHVPRSIFSNTVLFR